MTSTVPAALAALEQVATSALALQVGRGTLLETEDDLLIVGYDEGDNAAAVTGTMHDDTGDLAGFSEGESYDIRNVMSVWIGDVDNAAVVTKLFDYLHTFEQAIAADPTLGVERIERARITDFELQQPISNRGAVATLVFLVHVDAWS